MKKKKIVAVALVILLCALVAAGTAAYDVLVQDYTSNIITTGKIDVVLEEHFPTGVWGQSGGRWVLEDKAMPGQALSKVVTVFNAAPEDPLQKNSLYTRAYVTIEISDPALQEQAEACVLPQYNLTDWFYGGDGWWYYDGIVAPGRESAPLFEQVMLTGDTPNSFMGKTVTIGIVVQAVQSVNNPAPGQNNAGVRNATGWPRSEGGLG